MNKQLSQFLSSFAIPFVIFAPLAARAQMVHRTSTGAVVTKVCARETVNIRQGITTDNPLATVQAFPIPDRPVVGTLYRNQCRYLSDSAAQYTEQGGHVWVNLAQGGWVASEFLAVYQEATDLD
jgi:hypothetical protein